MQVHTNRSPGASPEPASPEPASLFLIWAKKIRPPGSTASQFLSQRNWGAGGGIFLLQPPPAGVWYPLNIMRALTTKHVLVNLLSLSLETVL